jgi:hypothetical protein
MKKSIFVKLISGVFIIVLTTNCNEGRRYDVTFKSLLYEMGDRSVVTHWPDYEYKSLQTSSYNRKAITPDDHEGWFANRDHGYDLGVEVNQGRKEALLLEHNGPGVITRIWTPYFYKNLKDRVGKDIMFYLDGDTIPTIKTNFIDLVTGKGQVNEPFAQYTCRAGDLYLPVSFAKSCKITMADTSFYYIINYRAYEEGTKVETFKPEFLNQYKNVLNEVGNELLNPEMFEGGNAFSIDESIPSGESTVLKLPNGNNAVRHLEFQLGADNLPQALRSTVLEATFDDARTIWCPLGDFFANVNAVDPYKMWEREVKTDGTMICRWIMPYKENAELRLINFAEESVNVNLKVNTSEWKWDDTSLHFYANWWTDMPYAPRPVFDLNFIEIKGRGIHVGDNLIVLNSHWSWWGEGDEKIYVDEDFDRSFPSHFGTGTEDYYGWAGGQVPTRDDEFSTPFLGNIRVGGLPHPSEANQHAGRSGPFTHGYNICTRTRSLDATPFRTRFKFDMEAFNMVSTPDAFLQYSLVTFWYGQPGAKHNRKPMPEQAAAPVPQAEDVVTFARQQLNEKGK